MLPKNCAECGGRLVGKTITHTESWSGQLYRFEDVPALVCAQCGAAYFTAAVSKAMTEIVRKHTKPKKYERVPVFSLASAYLHTK